MVATPQYTDSSVAVFAEGNYTAVGESAESEGLLVVVGNATFDKQYGGTFNVGTVGRGSGIAPGANSQMLAVGGNLVVASDTRLDVGFGTAAKVTVGGTSTGTVDVNGGTLSTKLGKAAALAPNAGFGSVLDDTSAELASQSANGEATRAGDHLTLTGKSSASLQVFSVPASTLALVGQVTFASIPADAAILVNVTGGAVSFAPYQFDANGARVDSPTGTSIGNWSSRVLWNFQDASAVSIGGSSQFIGSILAPDASTTLVTASTNGRLHVGGNLTVQGSGIEHHNYPWVGRASLSCTPVTPTTPPTTTPPVTTTPPATTTPPVTTTPPADDKEKPAPTETTEPPLTGLNVPDPSTPSTTTPAGTGAAAVAAVPEGEGNGLASTGFEYAGVAVGAVVMLTVAGALLFAARRRRA
ncbi:choice-of-anchor A family protein [Agromyces protaetiae]|nr:choice-of-anchor A family protein [Agromyces protaetiae]